MRMACRILSAERMFIGVTLSQDIERAKFTGQLTVGLRR